MLVLLRVQIGGLLRFPPPRTFHVKRNRATPPSVSREAKHHGGSASRVFHVKQLVAMMCVIGTNVSRETFSLWAPDRA